MSILDKLASLVPASAISSVLPVNAVSAILLAKDLATAAAHAALANHELGALLTTCAAEKRDLTDAELASLHAKTAALVAHVNETLSAPRTIDRDSVLAAIGKGP